MFKDGGAYYGTHFWWDEEDNEYVLCATWKYEKGYDMPDQWHLEDLEVDMYNGRYEAGVYSVERGSNIWYDVAREGCPITDMKECD